MDENKDEIVSRPDNNNTVILHARFGFLRALLVLTIIILLGRSFYLQIVEGSNLHLQAEDNRVALVPQTAARGIIFDIKGNQLVENVASTDLVLDPLLLPDEENESSLVEGLNKYLAMKPDEIKEVLTLARKQTRPLLLYKALDHDKVIELEQSLDELPGVRLVSSSVRNYLYPYALAHVLGYTGLVTAEELKQNDRLLLNDVVGKAGLEKKEDAILRGKPGTSYVEVNAIGLPQKELSMEPPVQGRDMTLTINGDLQKFIFSLLAERSANGSVVVIDPNSGAVRSLVNYPSYDPNVFSQPAKQGELPGILRDERRPLFNRAIGGTYPPGSTVKPLIAAAGLQEKVITPNTTVVSTGGINIGPWRFPDWKSGGHGVTDVKKAIAESVNTFFYLLAGGDDTHQGLGVKKITKYLNEFSWGEKTGIDIPGEATGLVPSPKWKQETKNEKWYIGDTYHLGIGQGDLSVTPLQVAVATMAIANGGMVYQPYTVATYKTADGVTHQAKNKGRKVSIKSAYLRTVREGMRQAVTNGSARRLNSLPIETAGKTGTAQFKADIESTHAWFTGFGPYDDPRLVITVLLEKGGGGDVNAVPIAQEIWQWWAEHELNE